MNIFVLNENPRLAAQDMCDKPIPKMIVESAQLLASALLRHGAKPEEMPLTKKGTPYRGGYPHHPCTVWAGDTQENFDWLCEHAHALLIEYWTRFKKEHACTIPIMQMNRMYEIIPEGDLTPFAQAMPDEYKCPDDAIFAYREYYKHKSTVMTVEWTRARKEPSWWTV